MSYGLRNTLILTFVLLLITGTGFGYIHFVQSSAIEELEIQLNEQQEEYDELSAIAANFPIYSEAVDQAQEFIDTYDKTLFPKNDSDQIFKFLSEINMQAPRIEFNFLFSDSTANDQYGIISSSITGVGSYLGIYSFINRIENSRPVQKIENLHVTPINQVGEYGNANFNFDLKSYYSRTDRFDPSEEDLLIAMRDPDLFFNPFYPLIREPDPNVDNLVEVENSRLIGLSSDRIFLRDQNGDLVNLRSNAQVHLGRLIEIDVDAGRAVFRLNKGGIVEDVTLEVQR